MLFTTRVAVKASEVRPVRALLTVLAFPFYALGFLLGVLWLALTWLFAAAAVGVSDARARGGEPEVED